MPSDSAGGAGEGPGTISPSPLKLFFGWLLMAVGGLIALTCGLCTLAFMAIGAIGVMRRGIGFTGGLEVPLPLLFGGLPTFLGAAVFVAGWKMTRKREPGVAR